MRFSSSLALAFVLALLAREAGATITIRLDAKTQLGERLTLTLNALNTGEEAAHAVVPEVVHLGASTPGEEVAKITSKGTHEWRIELTPPPGPGTYPVVIRLRYADANGYPFSALLVHTVRTQGATAGPVRETIDAGNIAKQASVTVKLDNPGPKTVSGRATIVLPAEFGTEEPTRTAEVGGQDRHEVTFTVENRSALVGSVYPIYALFEYDVDGTRQAVVSETSLRVSAETPASRDPRLIGAGAAAAVLVLIAAAWRRFGGRRTASPADRRSGSA